MRPSVVVLGFVLGSAAAVSFSLAGVTIVFGLLRSDYPRLEQELPTLLTSFGLFALLTAAAAASFYGQLRDRSWRRLAITVLLVELAFVGWFYWPP
jgi:hypothetical protein